MNRKLLDFELISKYRTELMGIGILGVILSHVIALTSIHYPQILLTLFFQVTRFVYTEGFLFLSGFGIYYSLYKHNLHITSFYKRRLFRLYIPYLIITIPFFLLFIYENRIGWIDFFLNVTTLFFWVRGNSYGFWYIAISMLLYFLAPVAYYVGNRKKSLLIYWLIIVSMTFINNVIAWLNPTYFSMISIGLSRIICFFFGMLIGKLSVQKKTLNLTGGGITIVILILLWQLPLRGGFEDFHSIIQKCVLLPLICIIFSKTNTTMIFILIQKPLKWLGAYTLELYILHLAFYSLFTKYNVNYKIELAILLSLILCSPIHKCIGRLKKTEHK